MRSIPAQWRFSPGVTYLNHGSFGPSPAPVTAARAECLARLNANPMEFLLRELPGHLDWAADQLAKFLRCPADNLVFVANSTAGMNIVAQNTALQPGDEVLLTDHEYGAVIRIWGQRCAAAGARTVSARLPYPPGSTDEILETLFASATPRTKVIVVSHVTSPTAVVLPVREICEGARELGIASVVDGPHALAMLDLDLDSIPCDFYTASGHKWLSAPFGNGFLYVRSRHKQGLKSPITSWGRNFLGQPPHWRDEFHWPGTYDPTPWLTIPAAIAFLEEYGLDRWRSECRELAQHAGTLLHDATGGAVHSSPELTMATVELPAHIAPEHPAGLHPLQVWLSEQQGIEAPVISWRDRRLLRVSCHLYNTQAQLKFLADSVAEWLREVAT